MPRVSSDSVLEVGGTGDTGDASSVLVGLLRCHAGEGPLERRGRSWGRTIAFARQELALAGQRLRLGTPGAPFIVWVLDATDEVEGALATEGCFDDVVMHDQEPCEVVLCGHRAIPRCSAAKASNGNVKVRASSYGDVAATSSPDLVAILNAPKTQMAGKVSSGAAVQSQLCLPTEVLGTVVAARAPCVLSLRSKLPKTIVAHLQTFGDQLAFGPKRCPLAALAHNPDACFDDNYSVLGLRCARVLDKLLSMQLEEMPEYLELPERMSAVFWGILDIKYDPRRAIFDRVKILETGPGRSSRFSHDGAEIPKRFYTRYRLEEGPAVGKNMVTSVNKKLTHDLIDLACFEHLLPRQACFPRIYDSALAARIVEALGSSAGDLVVLKLCNRSRGAGVVPVYARELDRVLQSLLRPPKDIEAWLAKQLSQGDATVLSGLEWGCSEEQARHWWANECSHFIAEEYIASAPVWQDGQCYDGCLRVAFALRRRSVPQGVVQKRTGKETLALWKQLPDPDDLIVEWIGGYWKLPRVNIDSSQVRERVVSAARTSGTAVVPLSQLFEVYAALGNSMQWLFGGQNPNAVMLAQWYNEEPEFSAYLIAQLGMSLPDLSESRQVVQFAESAMPFADDGPAKRCSESFHFRVLGVLEALAPLGEWGKARQYFESSLERLPSNATSMYCLGMAHLELGQAEPAAVCFRRCLVLDLDYFAPYVNLGVALLRLGEPDAAILVSEAGLVRHPQAPQCHYHIGLACVLKAVALEVTSIAHHVSSVTEYRRLTLRAKGAFNAARDSDEARLSKLHKPPATPWLPQDDALLAALGTSSESAAAGLRSVELPLSPAIGWTFYGWRT